eukprot:8884280-Ditylum_brightwellii.AAC.1
MGMVQSRKKNRNELKAEILAINLLANLRGSSTKLQETARTLGINVSVSEDKIWEGWLNKPKGMKQILY